MEGNLHKWEVLKKRDLPLVSLVVSFDSPIPHLGSSPVYLIIINTLFGLLGKRPQLRATPHEMRKRQERPLVGSCQLPGPTGGPRHIAPGQLVRGPESRRHSNWREQRATSSLCALWISGPGPVSSRNSCSSLRSLFMSATLTDQSPLLSTHFRASRTASNTAERPGRTLFWR